MAKKFYHSGLACAGRRSEGSRPLSPCPEPLETSPRNLLRLCRDPPGIPTRILHAASLIRVNPSRRQRLPVPLVDIGYINMQPNRKSRISPDHIGNHHNGVPDPHFCIHDPAVGSIKPAKVRPAKCLLQKIKPRLSKLKVNGRAAPFSFLLGTLRLARPPPAA